MAKAVFTHKPASNYDDDPYSKYHFPKPYLRTVEAAVGDFVVYYEPGRRGVGDADRTGRRAYFATARVTRIEPDPRQSDHYYAFVDDYLDFERAVPFREYGGTYERRLQKDDGSTNKGLFGVNVRRIADDEFAAICRAGFAADADEAAGSAVLPEPPGLMEGLAPFTGQESVEREVVQRLVARPFRDAAFKKVVQGAYAQTCAFTGLKIVNGGGRPEVEAAHIRPVAANGPDTVRNGLALSRTAHWMFDRGLVSVGDDFTILTTSAGLPEPALRLFNPDRRLILPVDPAQSPAPVFLEWHRRQVFKG
ncbi:MAG: HNH endonuclease [Geminicoccaceae bacterium]|nr:HNH endonuclease [Geminicoccaceae bacterium]